MSSASLPLSQLSLSLYLISLFYVRPYFSFLTLLLTSLSSRKELEPKFGRRFEEGTIIVQDVKGIGMKHLYSPGTRTLSLHCLPSSLYLPSYRSLSPSRPHCPSLSLSLSPANTSPSHRGVPEVRSDRSGPLPRDPTEGLHCQRACHLHYGEFGVPITCGVTDHLTETERDGFERVRESATAESAR